MSYMDDYASKRYPEDRTDGPALFGLAVLVAAIVAGLIWWLV